VTTSARIVSETFVFEGELDLMTAGGLRDQILARRSEADPSLLTLDMRALTFVDSVGVSLLVTTYKRLLEDGAQLHMILPERVRPVFEISGLVDVLQPQFVSDEQTPALD
jgi:anti-anti-sigma factor